MGLNALHVLAVLNGDIDPTCVPKQVKIRLRAIIQDWKDLPRGKRKRISMRMERCARMSFGKPDPYPDDDLSDVEDEF